MSARRRGFQFKAILLALFTFPVAALAAGEVVMHKDPYCGCCSAWADHMRSNGFEVKELISHDMSSIKLAHGLTRELASCHTAVIDGYVIEGHVPAADVKRLLEERPEVAGLSVPGMPMGSPGMEGPVSQPYNVVTFSKDGKVEVFSRH